MQHRRKKAPLVLKSVVSALCLASVFVSGGFSTGSAQSPHERKLHVHTFRRMPLKVKEVRNLQKEDDTWFRDLEIEVQNISDKPIYFISLSVEFPDIPAPPPEPRADGLTPSRSVTGFGLSFGALRLGDVSKLATPDDISLKPDETYIFKIPDGWVKGFEHMSKVMGVPPQAWNKIEVEFNTISFGDGTGYIAGERRVYPKKK